MACTHTLVLCLFCYLKCISWEILGRTHIFMCDLRSSTLARENFKNQLRIKVYRHSLENLTWIFLEVSLQFYWHLNKGDNGMCCKIEAEGLHFIFLSDAWSFHDQLCHFPLLGHFEPSAKSCLIESIKNAQQKTQLVPVINNVLARAIILPTSCFLRIETVIWLMKNSF